MSEVHPEDTGVSTMSKNILSLASQRGQDKYTPSYIARLINRGLAQELYQDYPDIKGLRKGHFIVDKDIRHEMGEDVALAISREGGTRVEYDRVILPSNRSTEILAELDKKISTIDFSKKSQKEIYAIAAFATIMVSTAHPFPDGNGRTAVGVADVIIRRNLQRSLRLDLIEKLNVNLVSMLIPSTASMYPGRYHPEAAMERAKLNPDKTERVQLSKIGRRKWTTDLSNS